MKHCVWIFLVLTISSYSQTPGNGVTDIDGNQYNSVIIGTHFASLHSAVLLSLAL